MPEKPEHMDPMENHYRKAFKGFREEPSEELLTKIKSKLSTEATQHAPRKKGRFIWLVMMAVLLSIAFSTVYLYRQQKVEPRTIRSNQSPETPITQPDQGDNQLKAKELLPVRKEGDKKNLNSSVQKEVKEKTIEAVQTTDSIRTKTEEAVREERKIDNKREEYVEEDDVDFYQKQTKQYKDSVRHLFKK